jgi:iron complex transport system substrate-binding protein
MMEVARLCLAERGVTVRFQNRRVSRTLKILMLGILTTLLITACSGNAARNSTSVPNSASPSSQSSDSQCQFIQHKLGKTKVCGQPQKVVALGPNMLEILLALQVQPAGYADHLQFRRGDFDNPSQQIPYLGSRVTSQPINIGVAGEPSLETLAKLKPDLILGKVEGNKDEYTLLSQIAPTLLFEGFSVGEWQQSIQVVAKALGRTEQAQKVIDAYNQRLASTRKELAPFVTAHPKVLMLVSEKLNQNLQLANSTDPCNRLVKELGFQLVSLPGQQQQFPVQKISLESLPQLDSDLIIVQGYNFSQIDKLADAKNIDNHQLKDIKQEWNNNAIAKSLRTSIEGRVYFIPSYICYGFPGPIGAELILDQLRQQLLPPN